MIKTIILDEAKVNEFLMGVRSEKTIALIYLDIEKLKAIENLQIIINDFLETTKIKTQ